MKTIDLYKIKNIIFDWGGVITHIDFNATIDAFNALGVNDFGKYYRKDYQSMLFQLLEVGEINASDFRELFRETICSGITDEDLDFAWFAMLKKTPPENIDILKKLGTNFRLCLLSNTNQIHVSLYDQIFKKEFRFENGLRGLFEKTYYSYEVGYRKPSMEIFQYALEDAGLDPQETLFIDDSIQNIKPAKELSIKCIHFAGDSSLADLLGEVLDK
ncbi:HAD family phosphatase [Maribellus sp. CM-23]|uniref:HAD family hydrolase n=1 Tax=Maribellus sp. CM-23 TaxID=2781026 RepID=UPI001F2EEC58|nr:HAD family phosphatase [Maribellus sp. CM-23]MCE4566601.1 HAD family phosphatase [Maribellus sp. CM-23]